jgi:endoglucanase
VYVKIGQAGPPYSEYWNNGWTPFSLAADEDLSVEQTFIMTQPTDGGCELGFHLGKGAAGEVPFDVSFDDIYLEDPDYTPEPGDNDQPKPDIRLNQTGYFPKARKRATIVCASTQPIAWSLRNAADEVCLTGRTTVFGFDSASGDFVHIADFSAVSTEGKGYVLSIEKDGKEVASHPFAIAGDLYHGLKYQALAYFYHNRSGIAIEMPFADSPAYCRPAGHPVDTMRTWPGTGQADYVLDVSKGWYDAGDHGKYVVNGGISVWTMMNQYERSLYAFGGKKRAFADGTLKIPENANGIPDILDEARWEMEMLLSMQVPEGKPLAGMAHHKGHDAEWTGIPLRPDQDPMTRYLAPVSTAATLNLAAVAAQSSRLWIPFDRAFSKRCLHAALKAWQAAKENPSILAPTITAGGGVYGDNNLDDEFYWAACELFVTTGFQEFRTFIKHSPHFLCMPVDLAGGGMCGAFTWDHVQGLGTVTLALVPNFLNPARVWEARRNIIAAADSFSGIKEHEGYLVPLKRGGGYLWGSNSFVVNNCIVSGLAYEFTGRKKYLDDAAEGMDYLLGRNAMDKSYVSGYGERPLKNPHHRFWARQANSKYPSVPAGVLSGGPDSNLEDPFVQAAVPAGTPAQKCYVDNFQSYSTNEITINWNAPLAWVAAFLDEKCNRQTKWCGRDE